MLQLMTVAEEGCSLPSLVRPFLFLPCLQVELLQSSQHFHLFTCSMPSPFCGSQNRNRSHSCFRLTRKWQHLLYPSWDVPMFLLYRHINSQGSSKCLNMFSVILGIVSISSLAFSSCWRKALTCFKSQVIPTSPLHLSSIAQLAQCFKWQGMPVLKQRNPTLFFSLKSGKWCLCTTGCRYLSVSVRNYSAAQEGEEILVRLDRENSRGVYHLYKLPFTQGFVC